MALSKSGSSPKSLQCAVPCEICESGAPGKHYCTVCKKTMCEACKFHHGKMDLCKNHRVVPRSEIASAIQSEDTCIDHAGNMVVMQCQKCNIPVCLDCISGAHNGHRMKKIQEVYEEERMALMKNLKHLDEHCLHSLRKTMAITQQQSAKYRKETSKIKEEMERELDEFILKAKRIHSQRVMLLEGVEENALHVLEEVETELREHETEIVKTLSECRSQTDSLSRAEIGIYNKKINQVSNVKSNTASVVVPHFQAIDMREINLANILGKLDINNTNKIFRQVETPKIVSSFRTGLEGTATCCTTKDGDAWVGGIHSKRLHLVDINGKVLGSKAVRHRPYCLAMMENGDIIISPHYVDSNVVRRLRSDGPEENVYDNSSSACNGISVTKDQELLICAMDKRVILYDGTDARQIYSDSCIIDHAIELSDRNICLSNVTNKQLLVINMRGHVLRSVSKPLGRTNFIPCGLAVDVMDNILVTDVANDCVYLVKPNEDVEELVGRSQGIKSPWWLSVDKDHNLWIGQEDGIVKIAKYLRW